MRDTSRIDVMPGIGLITVTLIAALPWGLPSDARFLLPLLPFLVIHHWAVRRPASMPEWLVFLSGLGTDVLTHGPLGFWSFIYLVGYMLSRAFRLHDHWAVIGQWLEAVALLSILAALQWLIASAYFLGSVDWRPLARGSLLAVLLYPLIISALGLFHKHGGSVAERFQRGG